jgi:DNA-binding NtrC family response regulator
MGLVLWIDENTFATGLIEKVFKKKDLKIYTVSNVSDFGYLISDLCPSVIVLDGKTGMKDISALKSQYESTQKFQKTPVVLIDAEEDLNFIESVVGELKRPLDPFKIPQEVEKFLKN